MKKTFVTMFALACLALSSAAAFAAVPNVIPYQGRLTDAAGNPVNGAQNLTFRLFSVITGGAAAYTEVQNGVTVTNGLFNVSIGSVTALPAALFTGGELFLEIQAGAEVMTPRQRFGTVPYAFRAGVSPGVGFNSISRSGSALTGVESQVSTTVTFPAAGFAIVHGQMYVEADHVAGVADQVSIGVNTDATLPFFPNVVRWRVAESHPAAPSLGVQTGMSVMRVFPVAAGAATFHLVSQENAGTLIVYGATISVQYVPDAIGTVSREPAVPEFKSVGLAPAGK